jgi:uncharacterized protein YodC (DUF2158 family)
MATELNVGDRVRLKSGGPVMTISEGNYGDGSSVLCQWFAGTKLETGIFPLATLESAKRE